jgi:thymidine phosphorylase
VQPLPQEIIRKKRDGGSLTDSEIAAFVTGIANGTVGEGQMGAFAMAVLLKGLDAPERVALTGAMAGSGTRLDWRRESLGGPVLDKHSTGGVGDKVSLILAPIIAAAGGFVPMVAGRGLGHTGGTLDKLSAIPGYRTQPDLDTLRRVVRQAGCAIIGATDDLAPADRRLYAVRDVTATVESPDLIIASILSKKLAAGLDALVMDVKTGSGAFLPGAAEAKALASGLVGVAGRCGLKITALLTDMNQVLGRSAGNALEVAEAIAVLTTGAGDPRLVRVTIALAGALLKLGGLAATEEAGEAAAGRTLADGRAAERFQRMVAALGGPSDLLEWPGAHLAGAPVKIAIFPDRPARVAAIDVRALGIAIVELGGGRRATGDAVDVTVGLDDVAGLGELVEPNGRALATIHARNPDSARRAEAAILAAFTLAPPGTAAPEPPPLIADRVAP